MFPFQVQSILFALLSLVASAYAAGASNAQPGPAPNPVPAMVESQADAAPRVNDRVSLEPASPEVMQSAPLAQAGPESPIESVEPSRASSDQPVVAPAARTESRSGGGSDGLGLEAWEYLSEIGFGAEYGSSLPVLHKWRDDVRIKVHGRPSDADRATLESVTAELNYLITDLNIELSDQDSNVDIHFLPESQFTSIDPQYVPVNLGFFRVWWDEEETIYRGRILISTEGINQRERSHLIREELTQTFGLFMDSWQHEDSIFYQGWTSTVEYSPLDREVIRLLYSSQLDSGMGRDQVRSAITAD